MMTPSRLRYRHGMVVYVRLGHLATAQFDWNDAW